MGKTVEYQIQHVLISQIVENVLSVAPASDDVVGAKDTKAL